MLCVCMQALLSILIILLRKNNIRGCLTMLTLLKISTPRYLDNMTFSIILSSIYDLHFFNHDVENKIIKQVMSFTYLSSYISSELNDYELRPYKVLEYQDIFVT